jgi:hypothetical protein
MFRQIPHLYIASIKVHYSFKYLFWSNQGRYNNEYFDINLQLWKFILPRRGVRYANYWEIYTHKVGVLLPATHFEANELTLYTNNLSLRTVHKVHKWMTQKVEPIHIPSDSTTALVSHIWFYWNTGFTLLLLRCRHYLECSAPSGKSLQLHVHA